jgi:outer membrane protein TolC
MTKHLFSVITLFLLSRPLTAQSVLENYIHMGLSSNLALQQKNFDLQKAALDLQRANAAFFPQAGFSSDYTLADGGRTQDIPVGDLLNPVYSTLNQLTASNKFPQVANQSIQFLPNDYHDTRMEISMPLVNADIRYNRQVSGELINGRRADVDIYKRELVRQIRQAYYQYLQAGRAADIYSNALGLEKENLRVSEKFVENRIATREIVLRAKAQVSQVESSLIQSKNKLRNAAAYFNFLLNRPLDSPLITDSTLTADHAIIPQPAADPASAALPAGREELARLRSAQKVVATSLSWDRSWLVPKLNAFYDVGFQGFGFHFDNSQFYQLAGLQLRWMLFKGGDNKFKIRQAQIDIASAGSQYNELSQQLTLQAQTAANDYASAVEALRPLADEVESASETYRLAQRRFAEGQALQIELIDARTQMTGAEIRYSLGQLTVLDRAAELERVTASYKL